MGGGVGERLKPAVLKIVRWYYTSLQINNLAIVLVHRFRLFWALLSAKCATECATKIILCNSETSNSKKIDVCPAPLM